MWNNGLLCDIILSREFRQGEIITIPVLVILAADGVEHAVHPHHRVVHPCSVQGGDGLPGAGRHVILEAGLSGHRALLHLLCTAWK
jgi:hypothetical protein